MGAGVCCVQKHLDFSDWISDLHLHGDQGNSSSSPPWGITPPPHLARSLPSSAPSGVHGNNTSGMSPQAGWESLDGRQQQPFEAASLLPVLYEIRPPEFDESPHTTTVVHRKTEATRRLSSFQKPQGVAAQERLRSCVNSLQQLGSVVDNVAKIHEVFEDYMNVHLVSEHCTGGSVYERILERQYFTEQESAVLVKHMLEALLTFHDHHLYHGCLTPDSFRFLSDSPHAPLKLVDFGIELKVHRWEAVEHLGGGPDLQNPHCPQFFETCRLVFCAPEFAPPNQPKRRTGRGSLSLPLAADIQDWQANWAWRVNDAGKNQDDLLDEDLLADVIDEHADWLEQQQQQDVACDYTRRLAAADVWSIGAMAFLLLCGYPPFFAPSRNTILARIHRGEISFDPPFWSKISEDAKSFVSSCLQTTCWDRPSIREALEHPWIQRLADSSPSGAMFTSFMLNLRRFYRTSLIEMYVANMLATKFRREDMHDFFSRCREIDMCNTGFFTASDLKHVLTALGHGSVSEAISARFLRAFRHPGESYIDYVALLDSIYLRQQRLFEEELWRHFQRVCQSSGRRQEAGRISVVDLNLLFSDPVIVGLLMREIPESAGIEEASVCQRAQNGLRQHCTGKGVTQLDFHTLAALLLKLVRTYSVPKDLINLWGVGEAEGGMSTVL
mmetsp:Transcript_75420/g.157243  ORF Transcript_75420/g.157243 Transcript_75420/m.157243 type:complete len:669 (+) Transcript_75420:75-2081(+)